MVATINFERDPTSCEYQCPTDIECPFGNYLDDSTCKCVPWFDHQPGGGYCIDIILLYKLQFMCAYIMCMIVH